MPAFIIIIALVLLCLLYLWMICPNLKRISEMDKYLHTVIAHRGLHNMALAIPENSMLAYKQALKAGLAIEIDVHLTKDHKLVVFHDDDLQRVCNSPIVVEASTYAQLSAHNLNGTDQKIPLLSDVLSLVNGKVPLLIELKLPSKDTSLCPRIARILDDYKGDYLIQSFNTLGVHWFKKHRSHVLRGQLASRLTADPSGPPIVARFMAEHLLTNFYCRPDFISYKYADRRNFSLYLMTHLFHVPVAVWTLRKEEEFHQAQDHFHMVIFEKLVIQ